MTKIEKVKWIRAQPKAHHLDLKQVHELLVSCDWDEEEALTRLNCGRPLPKLRATRVPVAEIKWLMGIYELHAGEQNVSRDEYNTQFFIVEDWLKNLGG